MFARIVLPMLGGTPAVWNTCMVFYQLALLAGYVYAHLSTKWLGTRRQSVLHLGLLLLSLLTLPVGIRASAAPPTAGNPIPWLFMVLFTSIGFPFFMVSATAPLLQKWFADSRQPGSEDPYFLYGASNLGSLAVLLSYPVLIEPNLRLSEQAWIWTFSYGLLGLLILGCGAILWRTRSAGIGNPVHARQTDCPQNASFVNANPTPTINQRLRWLRRRNRQNAPVQRRFHVYAGRSFHKALSWLKQGRSPLWHGNNQPCTHRPAQRRLPRLDP